MNFAIITWEKVIPFINGDSSLIDGLLQTEKFPKELPGRHLLLCWKEEHNFGIFPNIIVTADDELSQFLSWGAVLMPKVRPLSSFVRIITFSDFIRKFQNCGRWGDGFPAVPDRLAQLMTAIVIGEIMTLGPSRELLEQLPQAAFELTYSYGFVMGLAHELGCTEPKKYKARYGKVVELLGRPPRQTKTKLVSDILEIIMPLFSGGQGDDEGNTATIPKVLLKLSESNSPGEELVNALGIGDLLDFWETNDVPREMQVRRLIAFANTLSDQEALGSFVFGLCASALSKGSTIHFELVASYEGNLPGATLWYFICSAMYRQTGILRDYNFAGLRTLRSLHRTGGLMDHPVCDISLDELSIYSEGNDLLRNLRQANPGYLRVEICAASVATFRWTRKSSEQGELSLQDSKSVNAPVGIEPDVEGRILSAIDILKEIISRGSHNADESKMKSKRRR